MSEVFIIPARGGSKGVPRKNLRKIGGIPLIAHSINAAYIYKKDAIVYVLTDDIEIKQTAQEFGAICPYLRAEKTSDDVATTESVIDEFLQWATLNDKNFEKVVLLQPTSPLRQPKSISDAIDYLQSYDSVLSVCLSNNFYWNRMNNSACSVNYDFRQRPRRQDIKHEDNLYQETGSIYAFQRRGYEKYRNRLFGNIGFVVTADEEKFEIDTEFDFLLLDFLLENFNYDKK